MSDQTATTGLGEERRNTGQTGAMLLRAAYDLVERGESVAIICRSTDQARHLIGDRMRQLLCLAGCEVHQHGSRLTLPRRGVTCELMGGRIGDRLRGRSLRVHVDHAVYQCDGPSAAEQIAIDH